MISISLMALLAAAAQVQPATSTTTETSSTTTTESSAETNGEATTPMPTSPDDEMICRSRMIQSYRPGERYTRRTDCRTRAEWRRGIRPD